MQPIDWREAGYPQESGGKDTGVCIRRRSHRIRRWDRPHLNGEGEKERRGGVTSQREKGSVREKWTKEFKSYYSTLFISSLLSIVHTCDRACIERGVRVKVKGKAGGVAEVNLRLLYVRRESAKGRGRGRGRRRRRRKEAFLIREDKYWRRKEEGNKEKRRYIENPQCLHLTTKRSISREGVEDRKGVSHSLFLEVEFSDTFLWQIRPLSYSYSSISLLMIVCIER